jgi:integrase
MPRLDINKGHVADAKRAAVPGAKAYDIIDTRARGLLLRVGPRGCRWAWKFEYDHRTRRMDLGDVDEWTIEDARTVAGEATALIRGRKGLPDAGWLAAQRARFGKAPPPDWTVWMPQPQAPSPEPKPWKAKPEFMAWTFRSATERYLQHVEATRKLGTHRDYRKTLNHPAFDSIRRLPVTGISVDEMQKIVDRMAKDGHHASAVGMVVEVKTFWKWLARPGVCEGSMITTDAMARLHKPDRIRQVVVPGAPPPASKRKHFPLMPELGRLVALARSGALDPAYDVAILLLVLAAQRNHAVSSAGVNDFTECDEEPGWGVWRVPPLHRKGASDEDERDEVPHAIPVPPAVWTVVKTRIAGLQGQHWLFPGFRPRKKGMPVGHMSEHTVSHLFDTLPGIVASPHDLRRALRTQGRKLLRVTPKELSLILDHAEGRAGSVTQRHYSDDE